MSNLKLPGKPFEYKKCVFQSVACINKLSTWGNWPCTLQHYNTIYYTLNIPFFLFILVNLYEIQHSTKYNKSHICPLNHICYLDSTVKIQISFVCWLIIYIYWCLITYIQICVFWNILLCVCWCRLAIFNSSNGMHILDLSLCKNPIWQKRKKTNISISTCCGVK